MWWFNVEYSFRPCATSSVARYVLCKQKKHMREEKVRSIHWCIVHIEIFPISALIRLKNSNGGKWNTRILHTTYYIFLLFILVCYVAANLVHSNFALLRRSALRLKSTDSKNKIIEDNTFPTHLKNEYISNFRFFFAAAFIVSW